MAEVKTNNISLAYAIEASLGVLPAQPVWKLQEPNDVTAFGATISKVARAPISKNRQRRKGTTSDLDSGVEFEADATRESLLDFLESYCFSTASNPFANSNSNGGTNGIGNLVADNALPTLLGEGFEHDALSAAHPAGQLIFTRGFLTNTSINNGLYEVNAGGTTTETEVVGTPGITVEDPADGVNATMEVAGFRFTDLTWTDATSTLESATIDETTIGLTPGQLLYIGGPTASERFPSGTAYARVVSVSSAGIVVDKITDDLGTGFIAGGDQGSDAVDLLFGQFIRNVPVDDADFNARSFQFEGAFPDLFGVGTDGYEYALGNFCNTLVLNLPLTDKATLTLGFSGTDTPVPTSTRKTNAATPETPVQTTALNTSSDIARLRITETDETGITTDFKSITLTLNNNVAGEKVLGFLGSKFVNNGNFDVDMETQVLFSSEKVVNAIRLNTTVTMDFILKNQDGAMSFDIPALTLGGGDKELPVNETVLINLAGEAFADPVLDTSIGISTFPFIPAS